MRTFQPVLRLVILVALATILIAGGGALPRRTSRRCRLRTMASGRVRGFAPLLSADGRWLIYEIRRVDRSRELRLRSLDTDAAERSIPWGERPVFADDSRRAAWLVTVSDDERERLTEAKEPVHNAAAVLELGSDDEQRYEDVARVSFDSTGRYLALLGYAPEAPRGKGADLRVVDLDDDTVITFGNVGEIGWSDLGSALAIVVATGTDEGNGVQLYDAADGTLVPLDSSGSAYRGLAWREDANDLAGLPIDGAGQRRRARPRSCRLARPRRGSRPGRSRQRRRRDSGRSGGGAPSSVGVV